MEASERRSSATFCQAKKQVADMAVRMGTGSVHVCVCGQ